MKITFTLLTACLTLFSIEGWCQWRPTTNHNSTATAITYLDNSTGFQVGTNGYLSKTSNGGQSWQTIIVPTTNPLNCVEFVSEEIGFVGSYYCLLKTSDYGIHWAKIDMPDEVLTTCFLNPKLGWMGSNGTIYQTKNGGYSYTASSVVGSITDITFIDQQNGWAIGNNGSNVVVYKTVDGGENWSTVNGVNGTSGTAIHFDSALTGWIFTGNGAINKTTDGGNTWSVVNIPEVITDAQMLSSTEGYITTLNGVFKTIDGGNTWNTTLLTSQIFALSFSDAMHGTFCSTSGINYYTNDGLQSISTVNSNVFVAINNYAIDFGNMSTGWSVGENGLIRKTEDGGNTWVNQVSNTSMLLLALDFDQPSEGWVVGDGGRILHTLDGGSTWSSQTSGTTNMLMGVDFTDALNGIAVGATGKILRTVDGGTTWTNISSGTVGNLRGVTFVNSTTGYICGTGNTLLKTTNGGSSWTSMNPTGFSTFNHLSVAFADVQNGILVGTNGTILRTNNGGSTWTQINSATNSALTCVRYASTTEVWISGYDGTVLRSIDAGLTWQNQSLDDYSVQPINGIATLSDKVFVVGNNGSAFQFESNCPSTSPVAMTQGNDLKYCSLDNQALPLAASGYGTISWYDSAVGGNVLAVGNVFFAPSNLIANTTYYAQDSTCNASSRTPFSILVATVAPAATITFTNNVLAVPATNTSYQWIDCNTNNWIEDSTAASFQFPDQGSYAVIVDLNGCIDTSNCFIVDYTEINDQKSLDDIQLFPNPSNDFIRIQHSSTQPLPVSIYNQFGQLVIKYDTYLPNSPLDVRSLEPGLYFITVTDQKKPTTLPLIKIN